VAHASRTVEAASFRQVRLITVSLAFEQEGRPELVLHTRF